jgi:hypothetical protein
MCLHEIVNGEARELKEMLELMRGHWDCLETALGADGSLWALEVALLEAPSRERSG